MIMKLARVTILVRDYDEALGFYTEKLGLEKRAEHLNCPDAHHKQNQKQTPKHHTGQEGESLSRVTQLPLRLFEIRLLVS